jgi:uncharacterized protein YbbC (DUF1343 family)
LGVLCNQASVDGAFRFAHERIAERFPGRLRAVFSPQHGLWGVEQANMIESAHGACRRLDAPIYSLYSETRKPTPAMLADVDVLLVDLQDVGTRIYTFIWTAVHCLEACRDAEIPVVVLDRPNPIGGALVEGPMLDPEFRSFVGLAPIPMRHGLTMAELVAACNEMLGIGAEIHAIPMRGWRREWTYSETGRTWTAPSPNLPRLEGVDFYPGMVLLEGTNLSEGRGTTLPFEAIGAPYLDPEEFVSAIDALQLPGVVVRPHRFRPTFDKWAGEVCGGAMFRVVRPREFRPYRTAVAVLATARRLAGEAFAWRPPPYEYETEKMPIDILAGSSELRQAIDAGTALDPAELALLTECDIERWEEITRDHKLYD